MSLVVENITKYYGTQKAIDGVSFTAEPNSIIGLIGPNGAGKTTTMKILTCYMPSDEGRASIHGLDIETDEQEIKRITGYLPEHNPLYGNMYVKEFLLFVSRIHRIPHPHQHISSIIEKVGLGIEQHKKISELSKGYKQRVGIAQAIIHDPKILILDEPISGLDPNQLVEIRNLIRELKEDKTIIFSSHILQEVESICDRVVILNKGRVITNESLLSLQEDEGEEVILNLKLTSPVDKIRLTDINGVSMVKQNDSTSYSIKCNKDDYTRELIFDTIVQSGSKIILMEFKQDSLESIFKSVTQSDS
ncbi:MAG: ATP-binding cassette domain-containing protein [Bacteroidia bacterium]|nr:ATP-binding cassette domain-containing protein [Bacteroidia bacterium]